MTLLTDMIPVSSGLLGIGFPSLIVLDRFDNDERKYIKTIYFILGSIWVFELYRYSQVGNEIDKLLGSEIFSN
jgi:hypothetical protein